MADPSSFSSSSPTTNPSNPNPTTTEKYLAKPPSACCFAGSLHEGVPRGTVETDIFGGIPTYVSRPSYSSSSFSSEEGKTETTTTTTKPTPANGHHRNVLLYFPDVWGLSDNAKLMMDGFADAGGFLVFGMDYFLGDPISKYRATRNDPPPPGFDHPAWLAKHFAFAEAHVEPWAAAVRARFGSEGTTRYAAVGYCFGAPFVCQLLAKQKSESGDDDGGVVLSAGAFAHPTRLKEEHFSGVKHPLLLSCAEHDGAFGTESRRKAIDILQSGNKIYHLQLFQGVSHGFASRGDLDNPYEKWCKEQSHKAITDWFNLWLAVQLGA